MIQEVGNEGGVHWAHALWGTEDPPGKQGLPSEVEVKRGKPGLAEAVFTGPGPAPARFAGGTLLTGSGIGAIVLAGMHRGIMPGPPPWLKSTGRL